MGKNRNDIDSQLFSLQNLGIWGLSEDSLTTFTLPFTIPEESQHPLFCKLQLAKCPEGSDEVRIMSYFRWKAIDLFNETLTCDDLCTN